MLSDIGDSGRRRFCVTRAVIEGLLGMLAGTFSLVAGIGGYPDFFAGSTLCLAMIWGLYLFDKHRAGGYSV